MFSAGHDSKRPRVENGSTSIESTNATWSSAATSIGARQCSTTTTASPRQNFFDTVNDLPPTPPHFLESVVDVDNDDADDVVIVFEGKKAPDFVDLGIEDIKTEGISVHPS